MYFLYLFINLKNYILFNFVKFLHDYRVLGLPFNFILALLS